MGELKELLKNATLVLLGKISYNFFTSTQLMGYSSVFKFSWSIEFEIKMWATRRQTKP